MPTADINDIKIHFCDSGSKTAEVVVLLHGLGSRGSDWEPQCRSLAKHYRVITIDLRGHGESSKPDHPYTFELFAADTRELLRSLNIEKYHLVGFSMGGMTAFQAAVDNPDNIISLTVINSAPAVAKETLALRWAIATRVLLINTLGMKNLGRVIARKLFPETSQRSLRQQFVEQMATNSKTGYLRALQAFRNWDVSAQLSSLTLPVLILASDQDYTPIHVKQTYTGKIPNARLTVIENSRHATPLDQPEKTTQVLLDFLQQSSIPNA